MKLADIRTDVTGKVICTVWFNSFFETDKTAKEGGPSVLV